jgi:uncharacterized protein
VLLFVSGLLLAMEATLVPVNWLSARGLLGYPGSWSAAVEWAVFAAALLPTLAASLLEQRPAGVYGLPLRSAFGRRFWEGALWGLGALGLFVLLLLASGAVSFTSGARGREALVAGAVCAAGLLGMALFEQLSTRGYLQFTLARGMGFWPAACLLSGLFALENLLSPVYRSVPGVLGPALFGLLYCVTLRRTGNLWFAVGMQAAMSWGAAFLCGIALQRSGTRHALLRPVFDGPRWLTGGFAGPEASLLAFPLIALLWLGMQRRFPEPASREPAAGPGHS